MSALHNPLLEEIRFPWSVPPLPTATGGPDPALRASFEGHARGTLELLGVTSRRIEVRIAQTP